MAQEKYLPANQPGTVIPKGTSMRLQTPGGGGFGPPSQRLPEALAADLRSGKHSPEFAEAHYGLTLYRAAIEILDREGIGAR
jgi:N-methylhydantoinase B